METEMNGKVHALVTCVTPNDGQLLEAVRLGQAMWADAPHYSEMKPDIAKMIHFAYNMRASEHSFFRVAVDNDNVIGFLIGSLSEYGFHTDLFAYDRLVYVTPDRRGGIAARTLVTEFERWAKQKGAARVLLGVTTGTRNKATERFYNKLGYETVGVLTMKEV